MRLARFITRYLPRHAYLANVRIVRSGTLGGEVLTPERTGNESCALYVKVGTLPWSAWNRSMVVTRTPASIAVFVAAIGWRGVDTRELVIEGVPEAVTPSASTVSLSEPVPPRAALREQPPVTVVETRAIRTDARRIVVEIERPERVILSPFPGAD